MLMRLGRSIEVRCHGDVWEGGSKISGPAGSVREEAYCGEVIRDIECVYIDNGPKELPEATLLDLKLEVRPSVHLMGVQRLWFFFTYCCQGNSECSLLGHWANT